MSTESKMTHHPAHHESQPGATQQSDEPDFWRSRYAIGLLVLGAAALYFLLTEHRAHFFSALPFLILLSCPLMHVFMHGGHGGHGGHAGHQGDGAKATQDGDQGPGGCAPAQDTAAKSGAAKQGETP